MIEHLAVCCKSLSPQLEYKQRSENYNAAQTMATSKYSRLAMLNHTRITKYSR